MYLHLKHPTKKFLSFILFLMFSLIFTTPLSANAANNVSPNLIAEYDLLKGGTQEFTVENPDGTTAYITITEIPGNSRVSNGTYKINYEVPLVWEAGFYVDITTNQIKSAYSPYYTLFTGSIKSTKLTRESTSQASYYLSYNIGILTNNSGVRATITGTTLVLEYK